MKLYAGIDLHSNNSEVSVIEARSPRRGAALRVSGSLEVASQVADFPTGTFLAARW